MSDKNFASVQLLCGFNGADAATSTTDESSAARAITFNGNAQLDTAQKKWGTASLLCDGNGDYVSVASAAALALAAGDFTVEAWCWANSYPNTFNGLCGKWGASGQRGWDFGYRPASSRWEFFYSTNGTASASSVGTVAQATGGWHHIAASRIGASLRMFLDGIEMSTPFNIGADSINNSTESLKIGRGSAASAEYWDGWIDDFRLTVGVGRYSANFRPPRGPLDRAKNTGVSGDRRAIIQLLHH